MTSRELYNSIRCKEETSYVAQILADGLSVNMADFLTKLIKDAARCNNYSSDVIYSVSEINEALEQYDPAKEFDPIWIGFRKLGVDHTDFVVYSVDDHNKLPDLHRVLSDRYFALYSVDIQKDNAYKGFCNVVVREYDV